jgi:uncharacterized delta-60 repeat protein
MKAFPLTSGAVFAFFLLMISPAHAQPAALDFTFNPGSGPGWESSGENGSQINCMALETNGQIVVGGAFSTFNGVNRSYIARLNADGGLNAAFNPGVGPSGQVNCVAVQSDGKVLIGGSFFSVNGLSWNQPVRLRVDGSVDISFDTSAADGQGVGLGLTTMVLQPDGRILLGGTFSSVGGESRNGLARLTTNANLDVTFNDGTGPSNGVVQTLALQSTGQMIVGGTFTSFNGTAVNYIVRLNSGGSVDTSFNASLQDGNVDAIAITPQDQIVIAGNFTSINGYSRNNIARLNSNGSLDTTFDPGLGVSGHGLPYTLALQPDGKALVGGYFSSVNNTPMQYLARLNVNGNLDASFNPGESAYAISCVASHSREARPVRSSATTRCAKKYLHQKGEDF